MFSATSVTWLVFCKSDSICWENTDFQFYCLFAKFHHTQVWKGIFVWDWEMLLFVYDSHVAILVSLWGPRGLCACRRRFFSSTKTHPRIFWKITLPQLIRVREQFWIFWDLDFLAHDTCSYAYFKITMFWTSDIWGKLHILKLWACINAHVIMAFCGYMDAADHHPKLY